MAHALAMSQIDFDEMPLNARRQLNITPAGEEADPNSAIEVIVMVGVRRHPRLALVAGVHGDEYDGILALQRLSRELEPERIHGTLVIVPVANPFAFAAAQRRTPQDGKDLNRVFPGSPTGSLSERLAYTLCIGLLRQADLVFTLHGSAVHGVLAPWIEFLNEPTPVGRATYQAARASGFPDLIALPRLPGVLQTGLAELGVPVIEGEVGGLGATLPENVGYYTERALSVARHIDVLGNGEGAAIPGSQQIWGLRPIEAAANGIFLREAALRQNVTSGERLATLVDISGEHVETVRAPEDGLIGGFRNHAGVRAGDRVFSLWTPAQLSLE